MAASPPATQATTIAHRNRTANRPTAAKAKELLTEAIVAGPKVNLLGLAAIVAGAGPVCALRGDVKLLRGRSA